MTKIFLAMGISLLVFMAEAQTSPYTRIAFNWEYTPNLPVCGTVPVSCFTGFRMNDLLSGHAVSGLLSPSARSWTFIPAAGVQYGKHTFNLVAVGYDVKGGLVQSTPASVIVDVVPPPSAPTAFAAALQ